MKRYLNRLFQAGGIFVDRAALVVVQQKLRQSIYGGAAYLQVILNGFEKTVTVYYIVGIAQILIYICARPKDFMTALEQCTLLRLG